VAGPEGVRLVSYQPTMPTLRWFVTADCKEPELAFRVGDFLFNEDSYLFSRYGVENQDWSVPPEGTPCTYGALGFDAIFQQNVNIWSIAENSHWKRNAPVFGYKAIQGGALLNDENRIAEAVMALHANYLPPADTFVYKLIFTEEETQRIAEIRATLRTYVKESRVRFITRDLDLDKEWENYLLEIERIGLQEFLEVSQAAYDRMLGK
jgi:putative aldouronate transport system substrate-binding protein